MGMIYRIIVGKLFGCESFPSSFVTLNGETAWKLEHFVNMPSLINKTTFIAKKAEKRRRSCNIRKPRNIPIPLSVAATDRIEWKQLEQKINSIWREKVKCRTKFDPARLSTKNSIAFGISRVIFQFCYQFVPFLDNNKAGFKGIFASIHISWKFLIKKLFVNSLSISFYSGANF